MYGSSLHAHCPLVRYLCIGEGQVRRGRRPGRALCPMPGQVARLHPRVSPRGEHSGQEAAPRPRRQVYQGRTARFREGADQAG